MQNRQFFLELEGNGDVGFFDILVALHQNLVCLLVLSVLLLGGGDGDCYLGCVSEVFEYPVEVVGEDGVFGLSVGLPHQIVQQFLNEMLLRGVAFNEVEHLIDENLSCLDVEFQCFQWVLGLVVLSGGLVPHRLALVIDCDLGPFLYAALLELVCVGVHLSVGLRHHKGLLFAVGHDGELDCLLPKASLFAVIGHDGGDSGGRALVPEDVFGLLQVVEVAEVYAHHILPCLGLLVRLLCLLERALRLFGLSVFDLNCFGGDFVHDRGSLLEHLELKVKRCCFFVVLCLFVDLSCL